jgi:hypothetical protein
VLVRFFELDEYDELKEIYRLEGKIQKTFSIYLNDKDLQAIGIIQFTEGNNYVTGTQVKVIIG